MLPVIMHLLESLRRALRGGGRHLSVVADVFADARQEWRASAGKIPTRND